MLTAENIVEYLATLGLCGRQEDNPLWTVTDFSSRNYNFAVSSAGEAGYFVKHLRVHAAESLLMMQREATVYWLAQNDADFEPLRKLTPHYYHFDGRVMAIVLGLVENGRNLFHYSRVGRQLPVELSAGLGQSLGALHKGVGTRTRSDPPRAAFPLVAPGILTAHRNGPLLRWLGNGQMKIVEMIAEDRRLVDQLDELAGSWCFDAFIHGDIKFENCVAAIALDGSDHQPAAGQAVNLVDWELADYGDPCWDVGCVLAACLYSSLRAAPTGPALSLASRLENSLIPLDGLRAAARAFCDEYYSAVGFDYASRRSSVERSVQCAAARLIQMALEVMHGENNPTPLALALFQSSREIAGSPSKCAETLCLL